MLSNKNCCGTCEYHEYEDISKGWVCVNLKSDNCADWTEFTDLCPEYEPRNT